MGDRADKNLRGMGISAAELTFDNITEQGDPAVVVTASKFDQAGPRPGQASSTDPKVKLEPKISGGQEVGIETMVIAAGLPTRGDLGMVWRLKSDSIVEAWRGRPPPNFLNHWVGAVWSTAEHYEAFDLVTVPSTQELILLYIHTGPGVVAEKGHARQFDFDLAQPAWGPEVDVTIDPNGAILGNRVYTSVCGVALPNDRVIAWYQDARVMSAFVSDDAGATWEAYSLPSFDIVTAAVDRTRAVYYRGDIAIFTNFQAAGDIRQFASNSLGTTFVEVAAGAAIGDSVSVVAVPGDGGIVVGYARTADAAPCVRILSSAFDPFDDATEIVLEAAATAAVVSCTLTVDGNGTLFFTGNHGLASGSNVWVWFSIDAGATWARIKPAAADDYALHTTHTFGLATTNYAATFCRGWQVIAHNAIAPVSTADNSIGTLWSSGWSTVSTSGEDLFSMYERRTSFGGNSAAIALGSTGIPIELPQDDAWIAGGAVAPVLVSPGEVEIATAANNGFNLIINPTPAGSDLTFFYESSLIAGAAASTALNSGFVMQVANGVFSYTCEFRFDNVLGQIRIWDTQGGALVADVPVDPSTFVQVIAGIDASSGNLTVAYRRPFDTEWIRAVPLVTLLTDGGAAGGINAILMGTLFAATVTTRIRQWHHFAGTFGTASGLPGLEMGLTVGFRITSGGNVSTLPVALPEVGTSEAFAFIGAERGPGRELDLFTIDPDYDFGIDRIFPSKSPSPADTWRSTGLTEQIIAWDFGETTWIGEVWLLFALLKNTNFKTAYVEGGDGATWTLAATYNAATGFEGLTFERIGNRIRPLVTTIDAARFLDRNVLAGGYASLGAFARPILRNSAGGWEDPFFNTTLLPGITLGGITGAEPTSGFCDLVFPAGVTFQTISPALPLASQYFRYWRLRIPVQTPTPDPYFEMGAFMLGSASVFGKQNSRGWSQAMIPNTSRRVSRRGTIRKRQDGPPARRWSLGWADGVFLGGLRAAGVDQDYLSPAVGDAAVAALDDVWGLLWGLVEETGGGESAVCALNSIPSADGTINDRRRFLYGTWDSSVQFNQIVGDENINEFGRIDPIRVSELV